MSQDLTPKNERVEELLSVLVTEGLNADQQAEFDAIDWQAIGTTAEIEVARTEKAAAAFAIAFESSSNQKPLPDNLLQRLTGDANEFFEDANTGSTTIEPGSSIQPVVRESVAAPPNWREALAVLAAAACLAVMLFNWAGTENKPRTLSTGDQMAMLLKASPADLVTADWTQVHSETATGKVHWSDQKQEGFMVFNDLPINDPTIQQYQLWVFDTDAEQAHPVDGGVFDIQNDGEVIVPIDVRVPVKKAVMFAVTIEEPGGVVVSKRKQIPVLAKVE